MNLAIFQVGKQPTKSADVCYPSRLYTHRRKKKPYQRRRNMQSQKKKKKALFSPRLARSPRILLVLFQWPVSYSLRHHKQKTKLQDNEGLSHYTLLSLIGLSQVFITDILHGENNLRSIHKLPWEFRPVFPQNAFENTAVS
jgi:hypothetical protein